MGCSLPGSSIHGIFQARVLEWVATSFRRSSQPGLPHCTQMLYRLSHQGSPSYSITQQLKITRYVNGNPLRYSCLENPLDGGAWWATVHGVAKSGTRLRNFTLNVIVYLLLLFIQFGDYHGFVLSLLLPIALPWPPLLCASLPWSRRSQEWKLT